MAPEEIQVMEPRARPDAGPGLAEERPGSARESPEGGRRYPACLKEATSRCFVT